MDIFIRNWYLIQMDPVGLSQFKKTMYFIGKENS